MEETENALRAEIVHLKTVLKCVGLRLRCLCRKGMEECRIAYIDKTQAIAHRAEVTVEPNQKIEEVVAALRGMALHDYANQVSKAFDETLVDMRSAHEHIEGVILAENVRLRKTLKRVNGQMLALREEFPSERVSHIIQEIGEAL